MIYVLSSKNTYALKRLLREARIMNIKLKVIDLKALISSNFKLKVVPGDVLYIRNPYLQGRPTYLAKIIKLAKSFKELGGRVVDANIAKGDLGLGKWKDYKKLKKAEIQIPKTELLKSYLLRTTRYPLIIKWIYGLKGKGAFFISSVKDLKRIPAFIPKKELMLQEFIQADYEYKVITVGFKALSVVLRFKVYPVKSRKAGTAKQLFNRVKGSRLHLPSARADGGQAGFGIDFKNYKVIKAGSVPKIISIAEKAARVLGRELSKVDILEKDGKFFILEVNRFPGLESFEKLTKYNVVKEFLKYLTLK